MCLKVLRCDTPIEYMIGGLMFNQTWYLFGLSRYVRGTSEGPEVDPLGLDGWCVYVVYNSC